MSEPVWIDWEKGERVRVRKKEGTHIGGENAGNSVYLSSHLEVGDTGTVLNNGVDADEEVYVKWDKFEETHGLRRLYAHITLIEPIATLQERPQSPDEIERFLMRDE